MSANKTNPSLSLTIDHPSPNAVIPPLTAFTVSGLAIGTGGSEPRAIESVTVQVDGGAPSPAILTPPPLPSPLTKTYTLAASGPPVPSSGAATFPITVVATDVSGATTTRTVTVRNLPIPQVATTPCADGVPWTNYPVTETVTPYLTCTPGTVADIVAFVREAEAAGKRVHAFGSKWSFSDCAMTTDYMIDTRSLTRPLQTVQKALGSGQAPPLYHGEAGITIKSLYTLLDQSRLTYKSGLALETMGGSSGQTLAGAISTGTHGGDLFMGPLADSVLALHIVGAGGVEYWIEPSSGITVPSLLRQFVVPNIEPQNIIYDDATFEACLVSLGCMGVIYAVVLRVRPAYDLIETTTDTTWRAFVPTAFAQLNDASTRFLQVAVSPYADSNNDNRCLVTTRKEAPATTVASRPQTEVGVGGAVAAMIAEMGPAAQAEIASQVIFGDHSLSDDETLVKVVQTVMSKAPGERSVMVENYGNIMAALWPPATVRGLSYSVMDTTFGTPDGLSKPSYSAELFLPAVDVTGRMPFVEFVEGVIAAISAAADTFFAGYVSLRFTGGTRATLGMQQWNQTCAVEISCLQGVQGELELYTEIMNLASQHGALPHWGQIIEPFDGNGSIYPGYSGWRSVYSVMSRTFTARTFENALSVRWDLTTPTPQVPGVDNLAGPSVAVAVNANQFVFWKGTDSNLWEAFWDGSKWNGPLSLGMGPLGSQPTAGVDGKGATYVYWKGTDGNLWEAFWDGSKWNGPLSLGMGPLS